MKQRETIEPTATVSGLRFTGSGPVVTKRGRVFRPKSKGPTTAGYTTICVACLQRIERGSSIAMNTAYGQYVHSGCRNVKPDASPPRLSHRDDIAKVMEKGMEPDNGSKPSERFWKPTVGW